MLSMSVASITQVNAQWNQTYYSDEFGDEDLVSRPYIASVQSDGSFSNSAATNAKLSYIFFLFPDDSTYSVGMKLVEYGSSIVKAYSTTEYLVKIKNDKGNVISTKMYMIKGYDMMFDLNNIFLPLIKKNNNLKIYIKELSSGYASTYSLNLNCNGVTKLIMK